MKKCIIYLVIVLSFSCSTVQKQKENVHICQQCKIITQASLKQKRIQVEVYENMIVNLDSMLTETAQELITIQKSSCSNPTNNEILSCVKYIKKTLDKKTEIVEQLVYNNTGNILSISYYNKKPFTDEIGIYTEYDTVGKVIKTINYEKGYNICFHKALEIAKKRGEKEIEKYKVTDFSVKRIVLEQFPRENPMWIIGFIRNEELELPDEKICGKLEMAPYFYNTKYCRIDGITGKVISFSEKCITITYDN